MKQKTKNILWAFFALVMVIVFTMLFLNNDLEHIEDTNGLDDYTLQTITDENICKMDIGALNVRIQEP